MEIRKKMVIFIAQECDLSLNFKNLTFRFEFTIGFKVKKNMTFRFKFTIGFKVLKNMTFWFEFTIEFKFQKFDH